MKTNENNIDELNGYLIEQNVVLLENIDLDDFDKFEIFKKLNIKRIKNENMGR